MRTDLDRLPATRFEVPAYCDLRCVRLHHPRVPRSVTHVLGHFRYLCPGCSGGTDPALPPLGSGKLSFLISRVRRYLTGISGLTDASSISSMTNGHRVSSRWSTR